MIKINFKQPKYIFPLVVFIPLCALVYFVMQTFGGSGGPEQTVATDRINMELPGANAEEAGDKLYEMSRRFDDEDAFTAVGAIGEEQKENNTLEHGYSEEELNRLDAAEAERIRQQQELEELERSLAESRKHINSYAYDNSSSGDNSRNGYSSQEEFAVTWKKSKGEAMSVRKQSRADWVMAMTRRKKPNRSNGRTPLPKSGQRKRNATAPSWSSSPKTPTLTSSIPYRHKMKRWMPN